MTEFKACLSPYDLEAALEADRANLNESFILDVGRDDNGNQVYSKKHVLGKVEDYLLSISGLFVPITKLYIVGDWKLSPPEDSHIDAEEQDAEEHETPRSNSEHEQEWNEVAVSIGILIEQMPALTELTWISRLPFMSSAWEKLPTKLTKLVLDLDQPVRFHRDGDLLYKSYITPSEMKPLQQQTELKELRLLNMHDSFQPIIWETVFRNSSETGLRVLDLQMVAAPLVRSEQCRKAKDVVGLTVANADSKEKEYKGIDGKGILHYSFGTGEYLDDFCMRKARIASGLEEAKPLPLWCLKLDGFVIDHLPFEQELSQVVLLTCGENCIDSGLRAPTTRRAPHNNWSRIVNNATSHCLIQWPNWTGIFDDHGEQRDRHGVVVSQEVGLSTPIDELSPALPAIPLTEEALHLKELDTALDGIKDDGYFAASPPIAHSSVVQTPLGAASNASTRGSEVPTPTVASDSYGTTQISVLDGSNVSALSSPQDPSLVLVDKDSSHDDTIVPTSTNSSFEVVDATVPPVSVPADQDTTTPKTVGFTHKVRRSLNWFSGSLDS